jgi:hypothetical protein
MIEIYIAGAHSRAATMGFYLKYLNPDVRILAFLYDNDEPNPNDIDGVPVIKIGPDSKLKRECAVYLATRGSNHACLSETLTACGMHKIIPVDVKLDLEIRNRFLHKFYASQGRKYIKIDDICFDKTNGKAKVSEIMSSVSVYVASSAFDKPLQDHYTLAKYEKVLQVGAALTDIRIKAFCTDNTGENISRINRQFCELTGLYWIWKHAEEDYVGLAHYRRHFILPSDWLDAMQTQCVDVLLPAPLYVYPSIEENYRRRHTESNWDNMLEFVRVHCSDDYEELSHFFKTTSLYSPCNMFIMRREVLDDLCSWLFPILFSVAESGGELEDNYQNRYPGFISERLISFFFDKHRDKYKVVYADKGFLN